MANAGYDYRNPPFPWELNPEVMGEKMHSLNETQKMLRKEGHRISPPRSGLSFMPPEPIQVTLKGRNEKKTTHYITVEEASDEQGKQLSPQKLVLDHIELLGTRASVFDRIGISIQKKRNNGLSSRSSMLQRIQMDGLPSQEHSSIFGRQSSPKSQDDQSNSGLHPSVFHRLGTFKDRDNKSEGLSQKSIFERIGGRDIKEDGKELRKLRK
ncbi:hypothetical protein ACH5RR_036523 [Cinchona calisaya]|uniref:Uncharacterized protein n=1 Tax=Cinchona calisaya TaxID=153742 RepID=A0ABD2Y725_9GENT